MSVVLDKLYGMKPDLGMKLKALGIKDNDDLLHFCKTPADIIELARMTGAEPQEITRLVQRADLARIRGLGTVYMKLLEAAGIQSAADLARYSPEELRERLLSLNQQRRLVGRVPALAMVNGWVAKARRLPTAAEAASRNNNNGTM
ncbi:MAG: DUF4332 domain-containing protein [Anaerolineae bacterium]|nr:DUF4332 domain-containing protein [Anaerolineae bacterium]